MATTAAAPAAKARKRPPAGLAVFTESATVPRWVTAARVAMVLGFAAAIPVVLGVDHGRRLFWAAAIAALPLLWVVGGYHLWRRICPLAVFAQLARLIGRPGTRRVTGWLADHAMAVQLGLMFVALSLRLIMTNGTPWALAGFLGAVTLIAIGVGFFYTGKTWCNFLCPVGMVEKIYTEPSRLAGTDNSQCSPCTACKKNCPDIDLEQGYWKEAQAASRRLAYFCWPGIVLGFYVYYYLVAGNWDYYFGGAWTLEDGQIHRWLDPGLTFARAIPVVAAAPLTLAAFAGASFAAFALGERIALARAGAAEGAAARVRHRALVLAGFTGFVIFYFFGGQPTIRLAPPWVGALFSAAVVVAATAMLLRRWQRSENDFVQERFAEKILKRWEWGDAPPSNRLQDIVIVHSERTREHKARLSAYKEAVREMVGDGIVTRNDVQILDRLRPQLGISEREHKHTLAELSDEERQMFDPAYQGSIEQRIQQQAYRRDLERVVLAAASAGSPPAEDAVDAVQREHNVSAADHRAALAALLSDTGPVVALYREQLAAIGALAAVRAIAAGTSTSVEFMRALARWRAGERLDRALDLLAPVCGAAIDADARQLLRTDPERGGALLVNLVGETLARPLIDAIAAIDRPPGNGAPAADPAPLLALAGDGSPYVRATVVHLLTRFDDDASRTAVIAGIDDDEPLVREAAVHALGVRGRLGRERLARALDDPDPRVRAAAASSVKRGQPGPITPREALAAAEAATSRAEFATLDSTSRIEALTSLEKMMFLRGVPMFADLDPDDLEELTGLAQERRFDRGDVLCREGEPGDEVFVLIAGAVEARAGDRALGRSVAGSTIGEMAVFDPAPRSATVTALEPTRTLVIAGPAFRALLSRRAPMSQAIIRVLVGRMRSMIAAGNG